MASPTSRLAKSGTKCPSKRLWRLRDFPRLARISSNEALIAHELRYGPCPKNLAIYKTHMAAIQGQIIAISHPCCSLACCANSSSRMGELQCPIADRCQRHTTGDITHLRAGLKRRAMSRREEAARKCSLRRARGGSDVWYGVVDADRDAMPFAAELKDKLTAFCNFVGATKPQR